MKKTLMISIFILLIIGQQSFALGNRDTGTITAVVYVKSMFQLSFNQEMIDFATALPGKTVDSDLGVTVVSRTTGTDNWYLQVSNDRPLTSGSDVIPNKHFRWSGATKGTGRWYGDKDTSFATAPRVAYKSSEEEINNLPHGTQNCFKFRLFIPEDQPGGEYSCKVMFTMTE